MTSGAAPPVPDASAGVAGRRSFSDAEKRRIVDEASQLGVTLSQIARRYGISRRVLFRWKEAFKPEPGPAVPVFAAVQVTDAVPVVEACATAPSAPMIIERSAPGIEVELVGGRLADAAYQLRETRFAESLLNGVVRSVEDWATARFFSLHPSC
jgi:transposase